MYFKEGFGDGRVIIYQINPKSTMMDQVYGEFDPSTHEYQDGILSTWLSPKPCLKYVRSRTCVVSSEKSREKYERNGGFAPPSKPSTKQESDAGGVKRASLLRAENARRVLRIQTTKLELKPQ